MLDGDRADRIRLLHKLAVAPYRRRTVQLAAKLLQLGLLETRPSPSACSTLSTTAAAGKDLRRREASVVTDSLAGCGPDWNRFRHAIGCGKKSRTGNSYRA